MVPVAFRRNHFNLHCVTTFSLRKSLEHVGVCYLMKSKTSPGQLMYLDEWIRILFCPTAGKVLEHACSTFQSLMSPWQHIALKFGTTHNWHNQQYGYKFSYWWIAHPIPPEEHCPQQVVEAPSSDYRRPGCNLGRQVSSNRSYNRTRQVIGIVQ